MGVFSIPVTIGIDEEKIAQEIANNVETQVVDKISKEVEEIIYERKGYYNYNKDKNAPLREIVIEEVRKCIKINEEEIIKEAAKTLADKMARSKIYKETVKEAAEKVKNDM